MNVYELPSLSELDLIKIGKAASLRAPGHCPINKDMAHAVLNAYFDHIQEKMRLEAKDEAGS